MMKLIYIIMYFIICLSCTTKVNTHKVEQNVNREIQRNYNSGDVVTTFLNDSKGNLWIGTTAEGVFKFDGKSFFQYTTQDGLYGTEIWSIIENNDAEIVFGTNKGLCIYNGTHFETISLPQDKVESEWLTSMYPHVNHQAVSSLVQDASGQYWIGTNGAGVYHYDGENFTQYLQDKGNKMPDSLYHNVITQMIKDHNGSIWTGSFSHGGISQFNNDKVIHYPLKDGFGDGMISAIYEDKNNTVWVGTRNSGIHYFDGNTFVNLPYNNTGEQIAMATFLMDKDGILWIASYARKGIYLYDGQTLKTLEIENAEKLIDIKCITQDIEGNIWFGGRYGALWKYNGKILEDYTHQKYQR